MKDNLKINTLNNVYLENKLLRLSEEREREIGRIYVYQKKAY